MKKLIAVFIVSAAVLATGFYSCKEHTTPATPGMTLVSLTSGGLSLLADTPNDTVGGVPTTYNIIATFSNDIDFLSIRDSTIYLFQGVDTIKLNFVIEGRTLTIDPRVSLLSGTNLLMELTGKIHSTNGDYFDGRVVNFKTEGIGVDTPPRAYDQILYLPLNGSVTDVTKHDTLVFSSIGYTIDRFGLSGGAANFLGGTERSPVAVVGGDTLITPSMTISTWINMSMQALTNTKELNYGVFGYAGENGYYFEIGRDIDTLHTPNHITWGTNHKINGGGYKLSIDRYVARDTTDSVSMILRDGWHHLVLTYDDATAHKRLYVDGVQKYDLDLRALLKLDVDGMALHKLDTAYKTPALTLGYYVDKQYIGSPSYIYTGATNTFLGFLDDFRMYKVALTPEEISDLYIKELGNSK